jgi:hypothetical protein
MQVRIAILLIIFLVAAPTAAHGKGTLPGKSDLLAIPTLKELLMREKIYHLTVSGEAGDPTQSPVLYRIWVAFLKEHPGVKMVTIRVKFNPNTCLWDIWICYRPQAPTLFRKTKK